MEKTWTKTWDGKKWLDFHPSHKFLPGQKMWISETIAGDGALDPKLIIILKDESFVPVVDAMHERARGIRRANNEKKNANKKKPKGR